MDYGRKVDGGGGPGLRPGPPGQDADLEAQTKGFYLSKALVGVATRRFYDAQRVKGGLFDLLDF